MGSHDAEGTDPFGNLIQGCPELGLLLHEHQVQRVGQQPSQSISNGVSVRGVV